MRPHLFKNLGHYNKLNPTEEAATNDNPHGVVCDGVFKSAVRFFFYNLDFQLGTLLKINTILVVVAFSQPQLTTKNEIGNPFWGSLSHFFVGAILQQHL